MPKAFFLYWSAVVLAAVAMGIQVSLVPWLAVAQWGATSLQLGWIQASGFIPVLIFILIGGKYADSSRRHEQILSGYLLLGACYLVMAWLVRQNPGALWFLALYVAFTAIILALIQPLRDRLLSRVFDDRQSSAFQTSVVWVSLGIYVAQAIGMAIMVGVDTISASGLMVFQAILALLCWNQFRLFLRATPAQETQSKLPTGIREGITYALAHKTIGPIIFLVGFNGLMHIGVYIVAMPLLLKDFQLLKAADFALLQIAFVAGAITSTASMVLRQQVEYPGRSILFCLIYTALILISLSKGPTQSGLFLLVYFWGVVAGVSASLSRSLIQLRAKEAMRGRVLSIYQLVLLGSSPVGALISGFVVEWQSTQWLLEVAGYITLLVFVTSLFKRALWYERVNLSDSDEPV